MSAIPSSYGPAPQSKGPPMGIIIGGVVLVIVIVLVILWQTGVFRNGGAGASPSPGAPSPSVSQNALDIKKYFDGTLPVSCPNVTTAIGTWGDSVGMQVVPKGQSCPTGTNAVPTQGVTNTSGLTLCVVPGASQTPPSDTIAMYAACVTSASSDSKNMKISKNIQTTAATCNCPTGYTYDPKQPVNKRCVSPQGTAPESCNCPNGYIYNSTGLVSNRCEMGNEFRENPMMVASPASMAPSP